MLTDSSAPFFDLICREAMNEDNILYFNGEDKENQQPIYLQDDFDDENDKKYTQSKPGFSFYDHINSPLIPPLKADNDAKLLADSRVLQNLLSAEESFNSYPSTYKFQEDIKPHMRKTVTQWMLDVCDDQHSHEECFSLAVNYLDRVLSCHKTHRSKLQLIASSCLFIASKVKEAQPFDPRQLVAYTEYSITINDLLEWEKLVLQVLKWDTCPVIAHDFLPYLAPLVSSQHQDTIINHSQTFLSLCSTEFEFSLQPASVLACACVCVAASGVVAHKCAADVYEIMNEATNIDVECIKTCQEQVERLISQQIQDDDIEMVTPTCSSPDDGISLSPSLHLNTTFPTPHHAASATPTDVKDIVL